MDGICGAIRQIPAMNPLGAPIKTILWQRLSNADYQFLLAMRTYFDCGLIDVGVIVTRAEELNEIFKDIGLIATNG